MGLQSLKKGNQDFWAADPKGISVSPYVRQSVLMSVWTSIGPSPSGSLRGPIKALERLGRPQRTSERSQRTDGWTNGRMEITFGARLPFLVFFSRKHDSERRREPLIEMQRRRTMRAVQRNAAVRNELRCTMVH